VVGSGDVLWVRFIELNTADNGPGIVVWFEDPPKYHVGYCNNVVPFTMSDKSKQKVWTFIKTSATVKFLCNGVQISDTKFVESSIANCKDMWSLDFAHIKFQSNTLTGKIDIASDSVRQFPNGT
jgi:hypothetical protein